MAVELPKRPLSPVLSAVVWTLLSCGILLALCFLLFTLRFKNNRYHAKWNTHVPLTQGCICTDSLCPRCLIRIVKMSSPNLNLLTLLGSLLTYSSAFLFAVDERAHSHGGPSTAVLQVSPRHRARRPIACSSCLGGLATVDNDTALPSGGSGVDSLCRQYSGVWPNLGEDVATVQSVHAASA